MYKFLVLSLCLYLFSCNFDSQTSDRLESYVSSKLKDLPSCAEVRYDVNLDSNGAFILRMHFLQCFQEDSKSTLHNILNTESLSLKCLVKEEGNCFYIYDCKGEESISRFGYYVPNVKKFLESFNDYWPFNELRLEEQLDKEILGVDICI
jgi:hypothetical protein